MVRKLIFMFVLWYCANTVNSSPISIENSKLKLKCGDNCKSTTEYLIQIEEHRKNPEESGNLTTDLLQSNKSKFLDPNFPKRKRRQVENNELDAIISTEVKSIPDPVELTTKLDDKQSLEISSEPDGEIDVTKSAEYKKAQENLLSASERVKGSQITSDVISSPDDKDSLNTENSTDGKSKASTETQDLGTIESETDSLLNKLKLIVDETDKEVELKRDILMESTGTVTESTGVDPKSTLTDAKSTRTDSELTVTDTESIITDPKSASVDLESTKIDPESTITDAKSTDSESTIIDPESTLIDAKSTESHPESTVTDTESAITHSESAVVDPESTTTNPDSVKSDTFIEAVDDVKAASISDEMVTENGNVRENTDSSSSSTTPDDLKKLIQSMPEEGVSKISEASVEATSKVKLDTAESGDRKSYAIDNARNLVISEKTTENKLNGAEIEQVTGSNVKSDTFSTSIDNLKAFEISSNSETVKTPNQSDLNANKYEKSSITYSSKQSTKKLDSLSELHLSLDNIDQKKVDTVSPPKSSFSANTFKTTTDIDTSDKVGTQEGSIPHNPTPTSASNLENKQDTAKPIFHEKAHDDLFYENNFENRHESNIFDFDDWEEHTTIDKKSFDDLIDEEEPCNDECDQTEYSTNYGNYEGNHHHSDDNIEYSRHRHTFPTEDLVEEPCDDDCDQTDFSPNYGNVEINHEHPDDNIEYSQHSYDDSRHYFHDFDDERDLDDLFDSDIEFIKEHRNHQNHHNHRNHRNHRKNLQTSRCEHFDEDQSDFDDDDDF